jgi:SNF2-related domain/RING-type zinc-finger/Helicase conserved C-terminal domain
MIPSRSKAAIPASSRSVHTYHKDLSDVEMSDWGKYYRAMSKGRGYIIEKWFGPLLAGTRKPYSSIGETRNSKYISRVFQDINHPVTRHALEWNNAAKPGSFSLRLKLYHAFHTRPWYPKNSKFLPPKKIMAIAACIAASYTRRPISDKHVMDNDYVTQFRSRANSVWNSSTIWTVSVLSSHEYMICCMQSVKAETFNELLCYLFQYRGYDMCLTEYFATGVPFCSFEHRVENKRNMVHTGGIISISDAADSKWFEPVIPDDISVKYNMHHFVRVMPDKTPHSYIMTEVCLPFSQDCKKPDYGRLNNKRVLPFMMELLAHVAPDVKLDLPDPDVLFRSRTDFSAKESMQLLIRERDVLEPLEEPHGGQCIPYRALGGEIMYTDQTQFSGKLRETTIPTAGQVITHTMIRAIEQSSFMQMLGYSQQANDNVDFLSPYQSIMLTRISKDDAAFAQTHTGGIIANETGTCKTLSAILSCLPDGKGPHSVSVPNGQISLIVVPNTLITQWEQEVQRHTECKIWYCDPMAPRVDRTKSIVDAAMSSSSSKRRRKTRVDAADYDIVSIKSTKDFTKLKFGGDQFPRVLIASFSVVASPKFSSFLDSHSLVFKRVVVEEAHSVTKSVHQVLLTIPRDITWIVTATPYNEVKKMGKLLQLDRIALSNLNVVVDAVYHNATVRIKLDRTQLEVKHVKHYCELTEDESQFYIQIGRLILQVIERYGRVHNYTRLCRLLERLCVGGYVHRELFLRLLKRAINGPPYVNMYQRQQPTKKFVITRTEQAAECSFAMSTDECPICLCGFNVPVQLKCRHVFCNECLEEMIEFMQGAKHCPSCREEFKAPTYLPKWPDVKQVANVVEEEPVVAKKSYVSAASSSSAVGTLDADMKSGELGTDVYRRLLTSASANEIAALGKEDEFVHLQGKNIEVFKEIELWTARREPGEQIVMFVKRRLPSDSFFDELKRHNLTSTCAGVQGVTRKVSVANIQAFREGKHDILLISTRYSDGFDLGNAKELWMLNTDISTAKMEQSIGRITRTMQKYDSITIRVFVYRNMIDEFLWDFRDKIKTKTGFNRNFIMTFGYFFLRQFPAMPMYQIHNIVNIVMPGYESNLMRYCLESTRWYIGDIAIRLCAPLSRSIISYGELYSDACRLDLIRDPVVQKWARHRATTL